jgi:hypothetical protein
MNFRKNDIDTQLRFNDYGPAGVYNQLNWKVRSGADATHIMNQVVSVHEFMHNDLNNITAYGSLLQGYAYLAGENTPLQAFYTHVLYELVEQCRTAHEVYATWMSINLLRADIHDPLHEEVLADNEEYLYYYSCAAELVQQVPDLYLRRQIISAVINICFQSQAIVEAAIANLAEFDLEKLSKDDFPNQRLNFITQNCANIDWMKMLNEFVETQQSEPWYGLLRDALSGNGDETALSDPANETNSEKIERFIYDRLAEKFKQQGLLSFPYLQGLSYFKDILPLLDQLAPFNQSANPLTINTEPSDTIRGTLQNFVNETLLFSNQPLTCTLLQPRDIPDATKANILAGIGEYPHIFITGRTYFFMAEQYIFPAKEDFQWCEEGSGSFAAIRYAYMLDDERVVVYIPFSEPAELEDFLKDKAADIPVLSAISEIACYDKDWWQRWGDFFANNSATACILLDLSPLYYIEKVLCDATGLFYGKMNIKMEELVKSAMLFHVKNDGKTAALIVAPCSEIYAQAIHYYIQERFPLFENKIDLPKEHKQNLGAILSHVFKEEHQHYYQSKLGRTDN